MKMYECYSLVLIYFISNPNYFQSPTPKMLSYAAHRL